MAGNAAVNRWESGRHEPRLAALQQIADVTGATFVLEIAPSKKPLHSAYCITSMPGRL